MHHVVALALPQVAAFDLAIPAQVLGHLDQRQRYSFALASESAGPVPSTTGLAVHAAFGLDGLACADTVIVPGYDPPTAPVLQALQAAASRGARLVSVCTGAFALAAAGLLDGRRATTHWHEAAELAARHPAVEVNPDVLYVDAGAVLTSAGVAAGIDLCLYLVRADHARRGRRGRCRAAHGRGPHREGGQAQFLQRPVPTGGSGLAATCTWALQRLDQRLSVTDLACHAGWAPRTFDRRFHAETGTTPLRWLVAQRVLRARELLEAATCPSTRSRRGAGSARRSTCACSRPGTPAAPRPPTVAPTEALHHLTAQQRIWQARRPAECPADPPMGRRCSKWSAKQHQYRSWIDWQQRRANRGRESAETMGWAASLWTRAWSVHHSASRLPPPQVCYSLT